VPGGSKIREPGCSEKRREGSVGRLCWEFVETARSLFESGVVRGTLGMFDITVGTRFGVGGFRRDAAFLQLLASAKLCVIDPIGRLGSTLHDFRNRVCIRQTLWDDFRNTTNLSGLIRVIPKHFGLGRLRSVNQLRFTWRHGLQAHLFRVGSDNQSYLRAGL
jgi:hypothetical protein